MPPFVSLFVEGGGESAVGSWRYNWGDALFHQRHAEPISVECAISEHVISLKTCDEFGHGAQIMCLPGYQAEIDEVSQTISQRQNLGRDPATRTPYGLAQSLPFAP